MTVTLAEEIVLLSLDDESGAAKEKQSAAWAVAGGILLDLVLAGRVTVDGDASGWRTRRPPASRSSTSGCGGSPSGRGAGAGLRRSPSG